MPTRNICILEPTKGLAFGSGHENISFEQSTKEKETMHSAEGQGHRRVMFVIFDAYTQGCVSGAMPSF